MSNEITVKLKCSVNEIYKILESKSFSIVEKYYLNDTYFIPNSLEIEKMCAREILSKAVLLRNIIEELPSKRTVYKLTYKQKEINEEEETLKILHENGIYTILFMSPIFPYITDFKQIIEATKDDVDEYWFENLNLRSGYKEYILNYVKENYSEFYNSYIEIYNKKEQDYWIHLSEEIESYCKENKIKYTNYFYHEKIRKNKK